MTLSTRTMSGWLAVPPLRNASSVAIFLAAALLSRTKTLSSSSAFALLNAATPSSRLVPYWSTTSWIRSAANARVTCAEVSGLLPPPPSPQPAATRVTATTSPETARDHTEGNLPARALLRRPGYRPWLEPTCANVTTRIATVLGVGDRERRIVSDLNTTYLSAEAMADIGRLGVELEEGKQLTVCDYDGDDQNPTWLIVDGRALVPHSTGPAAEVP